MSSKYQPSRLALAIGSALAISSTQAATITVNTLDDPGGGSDCSLRSAIESIAVQMPVDGCAAGDGVEDAIVFDAGLTGTITLTEGRLFIEHDTVISGPGAEVLTIDAAGGSSVFTIYGEGTEVAISDLTLTGGDATFGGAVYIYFGPAVSLSDCLITNNSAKYGGGVELYHGSLEMTNCEVTGNFAENAGGGISISAGTAVVDDSVITHNSALEMGGGMWLSGLSQNPGYAAWGGDEPAGGLRGGGISASLLVTDSLVADNEAYVGGGIGAGHVVIGDGQPYAFPAWNDWRNGGADPARAGSADGIHGGGFPDSANLVLLDSIISDNRAAVGGGALVASYAYYGQALEPAGRGVPGLVNALESQRSLFSENVATLAGGGIVTLYSSSMLTETVIADNSAYRYGGGMMSSGLFDGDLVETFLIDSEVSGNEVIGLSEGSRGYGVYLPSFGGGIANFGTVLLQQYSSVSGNTADYGGGVFNVAGPAFSFGSVLNDNQGGGLTAKYGAESTLFATRVENNTGLRSGGVECIQSICDIAYSSITGNEGSWFGGVNTLIPAVRGAGLEASFGSAADQRGSPIQPRLSVHSSTISGNTGGLAGGGSAFVPFEFLYSTVAHNDHDSELLGDSGFGFYYHSGGIVGLGYNALIAHTIIANNESTSGPDDLHIVEFKGSNAIEMNWSLVRDTTGFTEAGANNIFDEDPLLGPLDFHGGVHSLVHSLLPDSPALDSGDPDIPEPPDYDQRGPGFDRILNARIDRGAFEGQGDPAISLSVTDIDFGDVLIGTAPTADVTATSTGLAPLEIGTIEIAGAPAEFEIFDDNCTGVTLVPTQECTFSIRFEPPARAVYSGLVEVPSNAPDSPAEVTLNGRGVAPDLAVDPGALDFGNVLVGTSAVQSLTVESTGDAPLTIDLIGFEVGGEAFQVLNDSCSGSLLAPADICTLDVEFTPPDRGVFGGTLAVPSDAPDSPAAVGVTGTGVAPELTIDPLLVDFGTVEVDATSPNHFVELSNTGDAVLNLLALDAPLAPFATVAGSCAIPGLLEVGEFCTLGYRFSPTSAGPATQPIAVDSDSLGGADGFTLQGNGAAVTQPEIPIPTMGRLSALLLGCGLLLLGLFGLRRTG